MSIIGIIILIIGITIVSFSEVIAISYCTKYQQLQFNQIINQTPNTPTRNNKGSNDTYQESQSLVPPKDSSLKYVQIYIYSSLHFVCD